MVLSRLFQGLFRGSVLGVSGGGGVQDPDVECWKNEEEDSGDPPRLWAPRAMFPGTAFTRSIGDARESPLALPLCSCTGKL